MSNHTPGPWRVEELRHVNAIHIASQLQVPSIASVNMMDTKCNTDANANLIAAAPELLEACEQAEEILDGPIADLLTGDSMSDSGAYDLLQIIRTVIAKATGKQAPKSS